MIDGVLQKAIKCYKMGVKMVFLCYKGGCIGVALDSGLWVVLNLSSNNLNMSMCV